MAKRKALLFTRCYYRSMRPIRELSRLRSRERTGDGESTAAVEISTAALCEMADSRLNLSPSLPVQAPASARSEASTNAPRSARSWSELTTWDSSKAFNFDSPDHHGDGLLLPMPDQAIALASPSREGTAAEGSPEHPISGEEFLCDDDALPVTLDSPAGAERSPATEISDEPFDEMSVVIPNQTAPSIAVQAEVDARSSEFLDSLSVEHESQLADMLDRFLGKNADGEIRRRLLKVRCASMAAQSKRVVKFAEVHPNVESEKINSRAD